jgi:hypothetical protein
MYSKKIKNKIETKFSDTIRIATFGALLVITFILIGIYLPLYVDSHPPVCQKEVNVAEILSISGTEAKVKLSDGSIINQEVKQYNSDKNKFERYLKVDQPVCLAYKNPFDYYLLKMILF